MPFFINLKYLPGALVFLSFFLQIAFWNLVFYYPFFKKNAGCKVSTLSGLKAAHKTLPTSPTFA